MAGSAEITNVVSPVTAPVLFAWAVTKCRACQLPGVKVTGRSDGAPLDVTVPEIEEALRLFEGALDR